VDVDWKFELADQLESHWRDQLRPRLDGLTDDEYFWEPVPGCWTLRRRPGDSKFTMDYAPPPRDRNPVTTIAWRLAHIVDIFGSPDAPVDFAGTAETALRQLDEGYAAWIRDVRAADLARAQGDISPPEFSGAPLARLILYVHKEVIHHGAEVCLLRDLIQGSPNPG
jgi:hypothetical protein